MEKQLNFGTYKTTSQKHISSMIDHTHNGFFGKILTQMKLELSLLRSQLFNYNLIDNPFCPAFNDCIETPLHYFTECDVHDVYRRTMVTNLLKLNPHLSSPVKFSTSSLTVQKSPNLDQRININKTIFRHVSIFMYKTKRFTPNT